MLADQTEELDCSSPARRTCSQIQEPGVFVTKRPFTLPPFSTFTGILVYCSRGHIGIQKQTVYCVVFTGNELPREGLSSCK